MKLSAIIKVIFVETFSSSIYAKKIQILDKHMWIFGLFSTYFAS
jgi:hypothetical protein